MNFTCSPAPANAAHIVAPLIASAGIEINRYLFDRGGRNHLDFIQYAYASGKGFYGHKNHTVVMQGDTIMGIGAFYSGNEYNQLTAQTIVQVFKFYPLKTALQLLGDFMKMGDWMKAPHRQMDYVANLGVAPEGRGKGAGAALLNHQKQQAIKKGRSVYALDVADNNPRAEALYSRLGFKFIDERPFTGTDRGIAIPRSRRMEISL